MYFNLQYPLLIFNVCYSKLIELRDALRDLVPFVQSKKHENNQWRSVTIRKTED